MNSVIHIDLKKLEGNLQAVDDCLNSGVQKMAVVKDNAYGHGMVPIAEFLSDKVEWFCVARIEEGIELRDKGIRNPVLVLEMPRKETAQLYRSHDLTASIADLRIFDILPSDTDAHIHFDTGMFRLGILPEDTEETLRAFRGSDINITGIYTHFANSDVSGHSRVSRQLEVFRQIRAQFPDALMTHTANSGAIFYYRDLDLQFDAVRPGVCLYGYAPGPDEIPALEPVIEWRSELVQVKKMMPGDKVGYGSRWESDQEGWLGVIPVGYAQGIFRSLTNKINIRIGETLYPAAGTISMDYIMVDLGNDQFEAGEKVTLLGEGAISAKRWAELTGTIPYEITTAISDKIQRIYKY